MDGDDFKQRFLAALEAGKGHGSLLDLIHDRHDSGVNSEEVYDFLQEIWTGLGFREMVETCPLRDELEFAMERVWYFGVTAAHDEAD